MEMNLAQRSPYSAASNPDLNFLVHCVGTFLGLIRSRNAKIVGTPNITDTLSNSLIIAHAFNKISKLSFQRDINGESIDFENSAIIHDEELDIFKKMPTDLLPQSWLGWRILSTILFLITSNVLLLKQCVHLMNNVLEQLDGVFVNL